MIQFKFTEKDTDYYEKWINFYPKKNNHSPFKVQLQKYSYFDPRPQIVTNITSLLAIILPFFNLYFLPLSILFLFFGWGDIYLNLPYNTGKGDEAESPEYGINTFSTNNKLVDEIWVYWGKKKETHISSLGLSVGENIYPT